MFLITTGNLKIGTIFFFSIYPFSQQSNPGQFIFVALYFVYLFNKCCHFHYRGIEARKRKGREFRGGTTAFSGENSSLSLATLFLFI